MEDGSIRMFESGAMVEYLLARYGDGRLAPQPHSTDYAEYLQWLWFAEATLARPLGELVNHGREFPGNERIDAVVNEMAQRAGNCLTAVAEHLNGRRYLLGDTFSAADIMMGYSILIAELLVKQQIPEGLMPYWETLQQRPGFQTARGA
jgi:glutathione S-transferase